jgi:hypothetical protein
MAKSYISIRNNHIHVCTHISINSTQHVRNTMHVHVITRPSSRLLYMGGSRGVHPLPAESALFEGHFSNQNFPQKRHSFIAQNQTIFPEKKCFFATRKDVESYSQMPGKRIISTSIFKFFWTPTPLGARRPFSEVAPPFQKSCIRLCNIWNHARTYKPCAFVNNPDRIPVEA